MAGSLDESFRFKFGQSVVVTGDHPRLGCMARIEGMPVNEKMLYGVFFEEEERGWAIPECNLSDRLDEPFQFKFEQMVLVVGDHLKSGQRGQIKGMPGNEEMLFGVFFEEEERVWAIPESNLTEDTSE